VMETWLMRLAVAVTIAALVWLRREMKEGR